MQSFRSDMGNNEAIMQRAKCSCLTAQCFEARSNPDASLCLSPSRRTHALTPHLSRSPSQIDDGYNITLTEAPNDRGGRLCRNFALTTPELPAVVISLCMQIPVFDRFIPCGRVTFPQITRMFEPRTSFLAR
jgi:hypothetical protein